MRRSFVALAFALAAVAAAACGTILVGDSTEPPLATESGTPRPGTDADGAPIPDAASGGEDVDARPPDGAVVGGDATTGCLPLDSLCVTTNQCCASTSDASDQQIVCLGGAKQCKKCEGEGSACSGTADCCLAKDPTFGPIQCGLLGKCCRGKGAICNAGGCCTNLNCINNKCE